MNNSEFEIAISFHGHQCPAMPLGFRAAEFAMQTLGVSRSQDKELYVIAETGNNHAAGCFLDGIMSATGCTYGKSNIEKTYYNKMAFTLIDRQTNRAVRVRLKDDFLKNILQSPFVKERKSGVLPQDISPEITQPLVQKVRTIEPASFLEVGEIYSHPIASKTSCFDTDLCTSCGERLFANGLTNGRCQSCQNKEQNG